MIGNKVGAKTYLEFTVHLLELGYFNPIVFCHDRFWFDRKQYAEIVVGFLNLLSFLYSCGLTIDTELLEVSDVEAALYREIMHDEIYSASIKSYELREIDFTEMNIGNARAPENCRNEDFAFVVTYLLLKTGSALNRKSIESIFGVTLTDAEASAIRKDLRNITGKEIVKRKDNSYEMR